MNLGATCKSTGMLFFRHQAIFIHLLEVSGHKRRRNENSSLSDRHRGIVVHYVPKEPNPDWVGNRALVLPQGCGHGQDDRRGDDSGKKEKH